MIEQSDVSPRKPFLTEDWTAVLLATVTIAAVLLGFKMGLPKFFWKGAGEIGSVVFAPASLLQMAKFGGVLLALATAGIVFIGGNIRRFIPGFIVVFVLASLAQVFAGQGEIKKLGLEYVIFALCLGLLVSHTIKLPEWLREAVRTEFYIKTGLVILGAGILFKEILQAGWLGLLQALGVVIVVWYFGFWLARRLKVDDEFATMLATAVSICGVSAAI